MEVQRAFVMLSRVKATTRNDNKGFWLAAVYTDSYMSVSEHDAIVL